MPRSITGTTEIIFAFAYNFLTNLKIFHQLILHDENKDLKTAIRAAGEHKQRITINVTIDGLRLRDERTGDSLYHHPVHKISFIAQDMTDSRAFGYIFGSPESGHRFFGIKTDKAASQVWQTF